MPRPREERETVIRFDEESGDAMIWSASSVFHRYMERLNIPPYKTDSENHYYCVPKKAVRIRLPVKRPLTDEQRAMAASTLNRHRIGRQNAAAPEPAEQE